MVRQPQFLMTWHQAANLLLKNGMITKAEGKLLKTWIRGEEELPPPEALNAVRWAWFLRVAPPTMELQ